MYATEKKDNFSIQSIDKHGQLIANTTSSDQITLWVMTSVQFIYSTLYS